MDADDVNALLRIKDVGLLVVDDYPMVISIEHVSDGLG